ncbi:MAG: DUF4034 domain-containing protein [Cyanobacteria bacterium HKST-UBA02]|nr:DUF4034 domain-containing protein [Cyanobacteria bacterium HKST-UBA02]
MPRLILGLIAAIVIGVALNQIYVLLINPPRLYRDVVNAKKCMDSDPDKARALLKGCIDEGDKLEGNKFELYATYGNLLSDTGCYKEAEPIFLQASKESRNPVEINYALNRASEAMHQRFIDGDLKEIDLKTALEAEKLLPQVDNDQDLATGNTICALATLKSDLGKYEEADELFTRAEKFYRKGSADESFHTRIRWLRRFQTESLLARGDYKKASAVYIETVKEIPEYINVVSHYFRTNLNRIETTKANLFPRVKDILLKEDFAALDKLASEFRSSKQMLSSGVWYLDDLILEIDNLPYFDFDDNYKARVALLKKWTKQHPDSNLALCARAKVLKSFAWKARGDNYANEVTEEGWKKFHARIAEGIKALDLAKSKTVEWYSTRQSLAVGEDIERAKYDELVAESQKLYPDHDLVVWQKAHWLQPQWNGEGGEVDKYMKAEADKRGGTDGDILYARTAWGLNKSAFNLFEVADPDWDRVKRGFTALEKKYPDSPALRGELVILAMMKNDEETAASAFDDWQK